MLQCCDIVLTSSSTHRFIQHFLQYNKEVSPTSLFYNAGVELRADDGEYGHLNYIEHATRGTLTLHSLYLLLWANFGAFCISLLTQPDSHAKIKGKLIDKNDVKEYCLTQLKSIWGHMGNNLKLTENERTNFITMAMMKFQEVITKQPGT